MEIQCGVEVMGNNGRILGTVSQVINDVYTGELRKFVVHRNNVVDALFFSPKDIIKVTDTKINVNVNADQEV